MSFSTGLAIHGVVRILGGMSGQVVVFTIMSALTAIGVAAVLYVTRNMPWRDLRPMPKPVRVAFVVYGVLLVPIGTALILGAPIFAWPLTPDNSIAYGIIFASAGLYFIYALVRPGLGERQGPAPRLSLLRHGAGPSLPHVLADGDRQL